MAGSSSSTSTFLPQLASQFSALMGSMLTDTHGRTATATATATATTSSTARRTTSTARHVDNGPTIQAASIQIVPINTASPDSDVSSTSSTDDGVLSIMITASTDSLSTDSLSVLSSTASTDSALSSTVLTDSVLSSSTTPDDALFSGLFSITESVSNTAATTDTTVTPSSSSSTSTSDDLAFFTASSSSLLTSSLTTSTDVSTSFVPAATSQSTTSAPVASSSNRSNTGAIVGGVVGVGSLIGLILLITYMRCRTRKDRDIANFDPQEFRHTDKDISHDYPFNHSSNSFDSGSNHRLPARIERLIFPFTESSPSHNNGNRYPSVYTNNIAGRGTHGVSQPAREPRPSREPVNQVATSSNPIRPSYRPASSIYSYNPSLSSVDALVAPFEMEKHIDHQRDLPRLAEQIENALARVGSRASSYRTAPPPRRKPIPQIDLPPLPTPRQDEDIFSTPRQDNIFSPDREFSPFADPISELPPNVRPGFVHVRQSTHTMK